MLVVAAAIIAGPPLGGQEAVPAPFTGIAPLDNATPLGFSIEGDPDGADAELCAWALDDWVRHANGELEIEPADAADARIRIRFVAAGGGRYGEMRPIRVAGRRGAEVYVLNDTDALGAAIAEAARKDPLFRDSVVYLTCLHETGHALGMLHTDRFADVMYFFGFGGDILAFFDRYRSGLATRADIAGRSGLSAGDIEQLRAAYPGD